MLMLMLMLMLILMILRRWRLRRWRIAAWMLVVLGLSAALLPRHLKRSPRQSERLSILATAVVVSAVVAPEPSLVTILHNDASASLVVLVLNWRVLSPRL